VNTIEEVVGDPLVKPNLIRSKDPKTGVEITIAPPPINNPYLKSVNRMMSFPPRFGEHNEEIYSGLLGYNATQMKEFKEKNII
jgi:formyl-CoA transferase